MSERRRHPSMRPSSQICQRAGSFARRWDARVILANLHTAALYAGQRADGLLDLYKDFPIGLSLASRVPGSTVLVDLFAGRDRTFVYVLIGGHLAALHLDIERADLSKAAAQLRQPSTAANTWHLSIPTIRPREIGISHQPRNWWIGSRNRFCRT